MYIDSRRIQLEKIQSHLYLQVEVNQVRDMSMWRGQDYKDFHRGTIKKPKLRIKAILEEPKAQLFFLTNDKETETEPIHL